MTRLSIRVDLGEGAFGPGKAQLLELIAQKGSIRSAAAAMDMSYRRAWLLLQSIEETFGAPAIITATGGAHGGGASLSPLGRTLIARYRAVERRATRATASDIAAMTKLARRSARA
jgi:molybdate transport system regulatory protein